MTTEQEWLGNTPYTHPSMPKPYVMPLLDPSRDFFAAETEHPVAVPPILVTVTEEVQLKYGPRKPVIHWEDVPAFSENTALMEIIRQAQELAALGIEPRFTMNGKPVDLAGPVDPHHP